MTVQKGGRRVSVTRITIGFIQFGTGSTVYASVLAAGVSSSPTASTSLVIS